MKKATRPEEQSRPRKADATTEGIGDHCLPSTIAVLANHYGLTIERKQERVPNRWGAPCTVTRYSLPPSQYKRARAVLVALTCKPKGVAA
jgi:hypothetical protein